MLSLIVAALDEFRRGSLPVEWRVVEDAEIYKHSR